MKYSCNKNRRRKRRRRSKSFVTKNYKNIERKKLKKIGKSVFVE